MKDMNWKIYLHPFNIAPENHGLGLNIFKNYQQY